jgi:hypothetical protein
MYNFSGGIKLKDKRFIVPVEDEMHEDVTAHVNKNGLDSVAAYIRMLIRADLEREKAVTK